MFISTGALLVMLALLVVVGLVIARPFLDERHKTQTVAEGAGEGASEDVRQRRRLLLQALRDLEFDHATGKVSDEDYQVMRAQYMLEIARLEREASAAAEPEADAEHEAAAPDLDAVIEQLVRARREATSPAQRACPRCGHLVNARDKFCSMCGAPLAAPQNCANCGAEAAPPARFCPECGTPLQQAYEAAL